MPVAGRQRLAPPEAGVSTVVSAVLVFSLIVVVLSIYTATIVPDRVADAEAAHMRRVASAMGAITGQVVGTVTLNREGDFSTQIELGTTSIPSLSLYRSSGLLSVRQDSFFANFLCQDAKLIARDGAASPGATFEPLGGDPIEFLSPIAMDVKIGPYTFQPPANHTATFAVTSEGNPVATLLITLVGYGSSNAIKITTYDSANRIIVDEFIETGLGDSVDAYTINALLDRYGFRSLLDDAQGRLNLTSSTTTAGVQAYMVYRTADDTIGVLGQGRDLPFGFQRTVTPATIEYQSSNNRFVQQTYALEGGAVVLHQVHGEYLSLAPFSIHRGGGQSLLRFTLINVTGEGQVSGSHDAAVFASVTHPTVSIVECSPPTLLLSTAYPYAWHAAWTDALATAGLSETQAVLAGSLVNVRLTGPWIIILEEARVNVRLA